MKCLSIIKSTYLFIMSLSSLMPLTSPVHHDTTDFFTSVEIFGFQIKEGQRYYHLCWKNQQGVQKISWLQRCKFPQNQPLLIQYEMKQAELIKSIQYQYFEVTMRKKNNAQKGQIQEDNKVKATNLQFQSSKCQKHALDQNQKYNIKDSDSIFELKQKQAKLKTNIKQLQKSDSRRKSKKQADKIKQIAKQNNQKRRGKPKKMQQTQPFSLKHKVEYEQRIISPKYSQLLKQIGELMNASNKQKSTLQQQRQIQQIHKTSQYQIHKTSQYQIHNTNQYQLFNNQDQGFQHKLLSTCQKENKDKELSELQSVSRDEVNCILSSESEQCQSQQSYEYVVQELYGQNSEQINNVKSFIKHQMHNDSYNSQECNRIESSQIQQYCFGSQQQYQSYNSSNTNSLNTQFNSNFDYNQISMNSQQYSQQSMPAQQTLLLQLIYKKIRQNNQLQSPQISLSFQTRISRNILSSCELQAGNKPTIFRVNDYIKIGKVTLFIVESGTIQIPEQKFISYQSMKKYYPKELLQYIITNRKIRL